MPHKVRPLLINNSKALKLSLTKRAKLGADQTQGLASTPLQLIAQLIRCVIVLRTYT